MSRNLSKCRICLKIKKQKKLQPIFSKMREFFGKTIADVLYDVSGIKIRKDPDLPSNVCSKCMDYILTANNLRKLILESDKYWKQCLLGQGKPPEEIKNEPKEEKPDFSDIIMEDYTEIQEEPAEDSDFEWPASETIGIKASEPVDIKPKRKRGRFEAKEKFMCNICGFLIGKKSQLARHEQLHKVVPVPKPKIVSEYYFCDFCGRRFGNRRHIECHIFSIHVRGKNSISCSLCNKFFLRKSSYVAHMNSHLDVRNFKCPVASCGKTFIRKVNLNVHMRIHTGERPYKCEHCDKDYIHYTDLKRHTMSSHTGERPYKCQLCNQGYVKRSYLIAHEKTHGLTMTPVFYTTQPVQKFNLNTSDVS